VGGKKVRKRKKVLIVVASILVILAGSGVYAYNKINRVNKVELKESDEELNVSPETAKESKEKHITNILLIGVDQIENASDSIMILTLDKDDNTAKLTSIMRDTYVYFGEGQANKINYAYHYGGVPLTISKLNELFNLSIIDWNACNKFACANLVKQACEYKKNNPNLTTTEIGYLMGGFHQTTIRRWLIKGNGMWCDYNAEIENYNHGRRIGKLKGIPVICIQNGIIFENANILDNISFKIFGIKLNRSNIQAVCVGKEKSHHGYYFKYTKDLSKEQIKEIQENVKLNQVI
jgi:hypothetical protein